MWKKVERHSQRGGARREKRARLFFLSLSRPLFTSFPLLKGAPSCYRRSTFRFFSILSFSIRYEARIAPISLPPEREVGAFSYSLARWERKRRKNLAAIVEKRRRRRPIAFDSQTKGSASCAFYPFSLLALRIRAS